MTKSDESLICDLLIIYYIFKCVQTQGAYQYHKMAASETTLLRIINLVNFTRDTKSHKAK